MKKTHRHTELSEIACISKGCTTRIKLRLVEKDRDRYPLCYRCWKDADYNRRMVGTDRGRGVNYR